MATSISTGVVKLVRKSNNLVEARYKFDMWETRIFTKTLTMIQRDDEDFKEYKIYLSDVIKDFDLQGANASYKFLKEAADKLQKKQFYIKYITENGDPRQIKVPIVTLIDEADDSVKHVKRDQQYIKIQFHPEMKPYLLQLKQQFTIYDVRNILQLPSTYSIRIYELLKQYEKIGKRSFLLQELKEILGLEDQYLKYGNFKQRIILKAQKDLVKYTDIQFDFEQIKKGRSVHKLVFYIRKNEPNREQQIKAEIQIVEEQFSLSDDITLIDELYHEVHHLNVSKKTIGKWLKIVSEEHIRKAIATLLHTIQAGKAIANPGGYLQELIRQPNLFDAATAKKEQAVAKKKEQKERARKKEQFEAEEKRLRGELFAKESAIVEALFIEEPDLQERMFEEMKTNRFAKYDADKSMEENYQQRFFKLAAYNAVKKKYPERFKKIQERYQPQIEQINKQIKNL